VLWWLNRLDERIRVGEEGLALLGDQTESAEAAWMNVLIAWAYFSKGDMKMAVEFTRRNVRFVERLPYTEELGTVYQRIVWLYAEMMKNLEEAMRWSRLLERQAKQHHDLRSLADLYMHIGWVILRWQGDLRGAISHLEKGMNLFTKIGDIAQVGKCLLALGTLPLLNLGNLARAEECIRRALAIFEEVGHRRYIAFLQWYIGVVLLCRHLPEHAVEAFHKAIELREEISDMWALIEVGLGQAHLAMGDREEAAQRFQAALAQTQPHADAFWRRPFGAALARLEEAYDDLSRFRGHCLRFQTEHPHFQASQPVLAESGELVPNAFVQWYLEAAQPDLQFQIFDFGEHPAEMQKQGWTWHDPFGDCCFTLENGNGMEIHAVNGRDLLHLNLSAPRFLRQTSGDCAAQTICVPVSAEKPAIGGILLWKDKEHYLRLERGTWGRDEIGFVGCLSHQFTIIGRGRLISERAHLRLERVGARVRALCSADGSSWYTVGFVDFPVSDPVQVGLHAIGGINRLVYPGAYPDGTAIRFEAFTLYRSQ
jgi:tetratricopeptide (TPR) repeat protein